MAATTYNDARRGHEDASDYLTSLRDEVRAFGTPDEKRALEPWPLKPPSLAAWTPAPDERVNANRVVHGEGEVNAIAA